MLQERDQELLSAYVDGELRPRRRREVRRLLDECPEAREVLRQMQENASRLRALGHHGLTAGFTADVMRKIEKMPPPGKRPAATLSPWISWGTAAAVLLAVGLGSFFYFLGTREQPASSPPQMVQVPNVSSTAHVPPDGPGDAAANLNRETKSPPAPIPDAQGAAEVVRQGPPVGPDPDPPIPPNDTTKVLTSPVKELIILPKEDQVGVSIFRLLDMDSAKVLAELQKDATVHLELPCKNGARATQRLLSVFKDAKINTVVEQVAQRRIGDPRLSTDFVVFLDDVTPKELLGALERLRTSDQKARESQFDSMIVTTINDTDRKNFTRLLGDFAHLLSWERPMAKDESKPKPPEEQALVLPMSHAPQLRSAEVKNFLQGRKPARPESLQVLLVIRGTSG